MAPSCREMVFNKPMGGRPNMAGLGEKVACFLHIFRIFNVHSAYFSAHLTYLSRPSPPPTAPPPLPISSLQPCAGPRGSGVTERCPDTYAASILAVPRPTQQRRPSAPAGLRWRCPCTPHCPVRCLAASLAPDWLRMQAPFLVGSIGTLVFDAVLLLQIKLYRQAVPGGSSGDGDA